VGYGPETTEDKFSCNSLNAFEKIGVSSRTVILNNIILIKDGQNISTIKYKKWIPGKKVL